MPSPNMIHTATLQVGLLLAAAWVLSHNICTAVDSSSRNSLRAATKPPILQQPPSNRTNSTLVRVGDGFCPPTNVSAVCDPDHLLTDDELATIQSLIVDAYQQSLLPCRDDRIPVKMGVYLRLHNERPHDQFAVTQMRQDWGVGQLTPCGHNGLLLYLTVSLDDSSHVYLSPGVAMLPTLNRLVLQSVEDGMKPFLRHQLYGQAIQAGILDLTAYVRGEKHYGDLQQQCLRDFYLSSWFFIFIIYCCGGRLILLVLQVYGRRTARAISRSALRANLKLEVEEKLKEILEHYQTKSPSSGEYMAQCCPICLEPFPFVKPTEETPLKFAKNQTGSDGKELLCLPCGHVFDHTCIIDWMITLRAKNRECLLSCPICLQKF